MRNAADHPDELLREFFRRELPNPWPPLRLPADTVPSSASKPRGVSRRSYAALAASVAILIAGLGLALPDALLFVGVAELEAVVLEHLDGHAHRRGAAVEHVRAGNDLGQVLSDSVADFVVMTQPVACTAREQIVPAGLAGPAAATTAGATSARRVFAHVPLRNLTLSVKRRYSCANNVVT